MKPGPQCRIYFGKMEMHILVLVDDRSFHEDTIPTLSGEGHAVAAGQKMVDNTKKRGRRSGTSG